MTNNTASPASIEIFDGSTHVANRSGKFRPIGQGGEEDHTQTQLRVQAGNFDARDPEDEVMFIGRRAEYGDVWVLTRSIT